MKRFIIILLIVTLSIFSQLMSFSQTNKIIKQTGQAKTQETIQPKEPIKDQKSINELKKLNSRLRELYTERKYDRAIKIAKDIQSLAVTTFGHEHAETAVAFKNLAEVYEKAGQKSDAASARQEAEKILKKIKDEPTILELIKPSSSFLPGDSPSDLPTQSKQKSINELIKLNRALKMLYGERKYKEAVPIAEKIKFSALTTFGHEHVETAVAFKNLAEVYQKAGQKSDAASARQEAEKILNKTKDEPTVLKSIKPSSILPGDSHGDSPTQEKQQVPKVFWNLWADRGEVKIRYNQIAEPLEKGKKFNIVLDLSALEYPWSQTKGNSIVSGEMAKALGDRLAKGADTMSIVAFLLPDTTYFEKPNDENIRKKMVIDLDKIRKIQSSDNQDLNKKYSEIKSNQAASAYVFGHSEFSLTTRTSCPDGWASVAIVLFHENRPIDEIKAAFCIGKCKEEERPKKKNSPSSFEILSEKTQPPDGSLYLLELDKGKLRGLFCTKSTASSLLPNCTNLENDLNKVTLDTQMNQIFRELKKNKSEKSLKRTGKTIMQSIFGNEIQPAYIKFKSFVREKSIAAQGSKTRPSLFVRVVTADGEVSPYIPYGLLLITDDNGGDKDSFLGQHFRVITPLPQRQSYAHNQSCLSNYVAFVPPIGIDNAALQLAQQGMSDTLEVMGANQFTSVKQITNYLKNKTLISKPTILLIQSHHAEDKLYWAQEDDYIGPGDFLFPFGFPSIAILNACETSANDEGGFVKLLNSRGVDAVVATSSEVNGYMTGRFVYCFKQILEENKKNKTDALPLSQLFHDATVNCLWKEKNESGNLKKTFGANALKYIILGNGDLPICTQ